MQLRKSNFLKFIGWGGAFDKKNSTAYFISDNALNLIDIGETNFQDIIGLEEFKNHTFINIFITHMHSDHVGGLSTLHHYIKFVATNKKVKLFSPLAKEILELFKLSGNDPAPNFEVIDVPHSKSMNTGHLGVESSFHFDYVPTDHIHNLDSYGILFSLTNPHEAVYFSGDSVTFPRYINKWLIDGTITEVYQDITNWKNVPHMHVDHLCAHWNYSKTKLFPYHNSDAVLPNGVVPAQFAKDILRLFENNLNSILSNVNRFPDIRQLNINADLLSEYAVDINSTVGGINVLRAYEYQSPYGSVVVICTTPACNKYGDVIAIIEPPTLFGKLPIIHYVEDSYGVLLTPEIIYAVYSAIFVNCMPSPKYNIGQQLYLAYDIDENRIIMSHNFYDYESQGGK